MRAAWGLGNLVIVATVLCASRGNAQSYEAVIAAPSVQVRSGASDRYYPTGTLRQGDRVTVMRVENGSWLAIKPPPGSFSWIQDKALTRLSNRQATVAVADAPVRVGSAVVDTPPNVEMVKAHQGDQVVILDTRPTTDDRGSLVPISVLVSEVRYIPASSVSPSGPVQTTASSSPALSPNPGVMSPAPGGAPSDPLWLQAEQARQAGNFAEAERLYTQLARTNGNNELQMLCYNRITLLRQGNPPAVPPTGSASVQLQPIAGAAPTTGYWPTCNPCPPGTTYQYASSAPSAWQRPGTAGAVANAPAAAAPPAGPGAAPAAPGPVPQWIGPGWLRPASFYVDNRETYVLETQAAFTYVTPQPGATLAPYRGKHVYLYGSLGYRGDLRTNYMVASQVAPGR